MRGNVFDPVLCIEHIVHLQILRNILECTRCVPNTNCTSKSMLRTALASLDCQLSQAKLHFTAETACSPSRTLRCVNGLALGQAITLLAAKEAIVATRCSNQNKGLCKRRVCKPELRSQLKECLQGR